MPDSAAAGRAIEAVWRIEAAKIIAAVARMTRDVGVAEELAQDALVAALEHWPVDGVPDNPAAWLMAAMAISLRSLTSSASRSPARALWTIATPPTNPSSDGGGSIAWLT